MAMDFQLQYFGVLEYKARVVSSKIKGPVASVEEGGFHQAPACSYLLNCLDVYRPK